MRSAPVCFNYTPTPRLRLVRINDGYRRAHSAAFAASDIPLVHAAFTFVVPLLRSFNYRPRSKFAASHSSDIQ